MSISATVQIHYKPTNGYEKPEGMVIVSTGQPFASLRFGPSTSIITDADTLDLIAAAATRLAAELREALS